MCPKEVGDGIVKMRVSYDMVWQKQRQSNVSSFGVSTAMGVKPGKETACRACDVAEREGQ